MAFAQLQLGALAKSFGLTYPYKGLIRGGWISRAIFKFCPSALEIHFYCGDAAARRACGNFDSIKINP